MSEFSPAAFAVVNAFVCAHARKSNPSSNADIAAALRAAADQVVPHEATAPWDELKCDYDGDHWEMRQWVRDQLLAIATELEAQ